MIKLALNKNTGLSVLLIVVTVLIIIRLLPVRVDPVLTLVISKSNVNINSIHQARDIQSTKEVNVDVLNIAEQSRFKHPILGEIGYDSEFFVDINAPFTVKQAGRFIFYVASDDGFLLKINDKEICSFPGSRPLASQNCHIQLAEGEHQFQLNYYQGYGNAGLKVEYGKSDTSKRYWVGQNSPFIRFK